MDDKAGRVHDGEYIIFLTVYDRPDGEYRINLALFVTVYDSLAVCFVTDLEMNVS